MINTKQYQTIKIICSDGQMAVFSGPAQLVPTKDLKVIKVEVTLSRDLPNGFVIEEIPMSVSGMIM